MKKSLEKNIRIVGLEIRTQESTAQQDIGALWGQAAAAGVLRFDDANYGIYTKYESDRHGAYSVIVGSESDAAPKEGQVVINLPAREYDVWEGEGEASAVAGQAWTNAWQNLESQRAYSLDFEKHIGSPEHTKMSLFIALK